MGSTINYYNTLMLVICSGNIHKSDDVYRQIGLSSPLFFSRDSDRHVNRNIVSRANKATIEEGPQSIEKPVSSSYSSVIAGAKTKRKEELYG